MTVRDHLGKVYASVPDMCMAYGVSKNVYYGRLQYGWSKEEALTTPLKDRQCRDHLGQAYSTVSEMCAKYGVKVSTYQQRIKSGLSVEEALTMAPKAWTVQDHLGNTYSSIEAMCAKYGLSGPAFRTRYAKLNWSLEDALTKPIASRVHTDHLGNTYPSLSAMCNAYGIAPRHYHRRLEMGWDLEKALTTPYRRRVVTDPQGKVYPPIAAMCHAYGTEPRNYVYRLRKGLTQAEALSPLSSAGRQFGCLKVIGVEGDRCRCQCVCGNILVAEDSDLQSGKVRDCGCGTKTPEGSGTPRRASSTSIDGSDILRTNTILPNRQNTGGLRGIYWNSATGKWISRIQFQKKRYCLGSYDTREAAYSAYLKAKDELHGTYLERLGIEKNW